jgi:hypothetical protein
LSGMAAMPAVSLRGAAGKGVSGFRAERGGGRGLLSPEGGGGIVSEIAASSGGVCGPLGEGRGRTEFGEGGRAIDGADGRLGDEPAAGGIGFGATNGGGD